MRRLFDLLMVAAAVGAFGCNPGDVPGPDGGVDAGTPDVCINFPERITVDTVVPRGCHLVLQTPILSSGVKLTLQPGARLIFSQDTELAISAAQVLYAAGTQADPILLTGAVKARGHWKGLSFEGTSQVSTLDWVTVEYAGNTSADADAAAVKLTADSRGVRLAMSNSTLRESQGWGLWAAGSAVLPGFTNNTLTKNTLGPASLDSQTVGSIDDTSRYAGNDVERLHVRAFRMTAAATWDALDVPYYLPTTLQLMSAPLTVMPGATFIFKEGAGIDVSGDAAALHAEGTAEKPIVFTAETHSRGAWSGLVFSGSNNALNSLKYATVEWGGDVVADADAAGVKCIADSHGVTVKLDHVTIRQSQGWGLFLTGSAKTPVFTSNVFTENLLGPAWVHSNVAQLLSSDSTYVGNDVDKVFVEAYRINQAATWRDLGVPYRVDGIVWPIAVLTLEPGVTLEMGEDASIDISGDAAGLRAVGTATQRITFTGATKTAGSWYGIDFDGSNNANNILDYCTVEYGGGGGAAGWGGMIWAHADSHGVTLQVKNSLIRHSATWGIWLGGSANETLSGNTLSDNASGDVFQQQ